MEVISPEHSDNNDASSPEIWHAQIIFHLLVAD